MPVGNSFRQAFLSAVWLTTSAFITPDGKIACAKGETIISVIEMEITNESWAEAGVNAKRRPKHQK